MSIDDNSLDDFLQKHNIVLIDKSLLKLALIHKSFANEEQSAKPQFNNERLEFLGDAILGMIISQQLYAQHPNMSEGDLSKKKAQLVCEPTLAQLGSLLSLGDVLKVGKGEKSSGGKSRASNIANCLEAVIGAVFLSNGLDDAKKFVLELWSSFLQGQEQNALSIDYKSQLQENLVAQKKVRPQYRVLRTLGPEHDKSFEVGLFIDDMLMVKAQGSSKKKAEQAAAQIYLQQNQ